MHCMCLHLFQNFIRPIEGSVDPLINMLLIGSIPFFIHTLMKLHHFIDCAGNHCSRGYKIFLYSTQLSMKLIMLINVKMPTIVGILTFISMINTTSDRLKAINFFICGILVFYEQLKFRSQLSWAWKKFYNLRAWLLYQDLYHFSSTH